jgi:hypothetical protein
MLKKIEKFLIVDHVSQMEPSLDYFFSFVATNMMYYTPDLYDDKKIIEVISYLYYKFAWKRNYNGGIQKYLLKEYKIWLDNSKKRHRRELRRRAKHFAI